MTLRRIDYVQFEGQSQEWRIKGFELGAINLLVGRNASGKTRTLNIIKGLANLFSGHLKPTLKSGTWKAVFEFKDDSPVYELEIDDSRVKRESYVFGGRKVLDRSNGGTGMIYAEKEEKDIEFQTPQTELAVVSRRDNIQHAFFTPLYDWGNALRHYPFGTPLGKQNYAILDENENGDLDLRDANLAVKIFSRAVRDFGDSFLTAIKDDMKKIGYPLEDVNLETPSSLRIPPQVIGKPVGLTVKEVALRGRTDQNDMSQGMFRALSILIQLNYSYLAEAPSCVLIDDIGEGLDFERSSALIDLLVQRATAAGVQLIMATNDRFVMNAVPLEMWSVLQLENGECHVYNYANSREKFDEFRFTGLNNFDFLAADFLNSESTSDA